MAVAPKGGGIKIEKREMEMYYFDQKYTDVPKFVNSEQDPKKIVTWGSFYWHGLTLIPTRISNHIPSKYGMKLLNHSQISMVSSKVVASPTKMDVITYLCSD